MPVPAWEGTMALNSDVSFTWVGHGTWKVRSAKGKEIIIDPWVMNNPVAPDKVKTIDRCDLMLITHGHFDHIHDALEIARRTKPTIICNAEIAAWLGSKGIAGDTIIGGNKGGTLEVDGIKVTLVHAEHSCGITDDNGLVYGGEACGLVIEFENGFTIYFAGDTDVFGDMALIAELSHFDVAFIPIGDFYTMGPVRAAKAVELLGVKTVVPMHFATFPILTGRPSALQELVGHGVRVLDIKPGDTV
jgi:L-ascorbate metabolism protein UlaG (beta-lactamase superfamily)